MEQGGGPRRHVGRRARKENENRGYCPLAYFLTD